MATAYTAHIGTTSRSPSLTQASQTTMARSGSTLYPQSRFKRVLKSKTSMPIANDNTDTLVYLLYMDYLSRLLNEAGQDGMTERALEERHEELIKQYRG